MPYRPYAMTETDRSYAYKYVWFSAACSVVLLPLYLFGAQGLPYGWVFGGTVGGLLASAVTGRTDDYYRSLCAVGHRWVACALSLYILAGWFLYLTDVGSPAGRGMLSAGISPGPTGAAALFFDGQLAAIMLAIIYHAGYGFQWLRDRAWSEDGV